MDTFYMLSNLALGIFDRILLLLTALLNSVTLIWNGGRYHEKVR